VADFAMPVAFRFTVGIAGADGEEDTSFQQVSGLEA